MIEKLTQGRPSNVRCFVTEAIIFIVRENGPTVTDICLYLNLGIDNAVMTKWFQTTDTSEHNKSVSRGEVL